jgi:uncharacterized OB-fold protein
VSSPAQIVVYECPKCSWEDFHAAVTCPRCHAKVLKSVFAGLGKLATFTVIRHPPKGFEAEAPYIVGLVDIDNGTRVIGRISADPDEIEIGSAVAIAVNRDGVLEFRLLAHQASPGR